MPGCESEKPEVCRICDLSRQQGLGHKQIPIEWCPPAAAEGALTHTDGARIGWKVF